VALLALGLPACSDGNTPSIENIPAEDMSTKGATDTVSAVDSTDSGELLLAPDGKCQPQCGDRQCGDDGCGGSCGSCTDGHNCIGGTCGLACDSEACTLGMTCTFADGLEALCSGTIDFDHSLDGTLLGTDINVENMYGNAGVLLYTDAQQATVMTNHWELASLSKGNSCATKEGNNQYWLRSVIARFVVPTDSGYEQGATHYVSLYIGQTWSGGIAVDFYRPESPPGVAGSAPSGTAITDSEGTDFVEFGSSDPIGYVVVRTADDKDFTIDDLRFGPVYEP